MRAIMHFLLFSPSAFTFGCVLVVRRQNCTIEKLLFSFFAHLIFRLLEEAAIESVAVLHDENDVDQQPRERCYEDDPTGAHSHLAAEHSRVVCH